MKLCAMNILIRSAAVKLCAVQYQMNVRWYWSQLELIIASS